MRYVTSDNQYTTTFPIAMRNILLENVPVDEEDYSRGSVLRDGYGVEIDEDTYIDINHRFADLEGEVRTLLAMHRVGIGSESNNDPDFPWLTVNQALLVNLAMELSCVIHTNLYQCLFKKNSFCADMLESIVEMADTVFADYGQHHTFKNSLFGGVKVGGAERVEGKCCQPTAAEMKAIAEGDYQPEELWGVGGMPSCPKCCASSLK